MIASAIFSWQSWAQKTIALFSTEAKYMALSDCSQQAVWIKALLNELGIKVAPIHINGNNQGSIFIGSNPIQEKRYKHIDIHYQCLEDKKIFLYFVEGAENLADMFTKNLGKKKIPQVQRPTRIWVIMNSFNVVLQILRDILARGNVEWTRSMWPCDRSHDLITSLCDIVSHALCLW